MKKRLMFLLGTAALAAVFAACDPDPGSNPNPPPAGSSIEMVSIPGGTFTMGSPSSEANRENDDRDETQHSVTVSSFNMGKYEVTQEQYQTVMGSNPSNFSASPADGEVQAKRPVEKVSWYDAIVFCNRLSIQEGLTPAYTINGSTYPSDWGMVPTSSSSTWNTVAVDWSASGYRLPTEAEWEYACRAGTTTAYNTGDTITDNTGWYESNSGGMTHEVGKKPENAWGLYDMHGNVWELCWDWYGSYDSATQTNPQGAVTGSHRVKRGGSWLNDGEDLLSAGRLIDGNPSVRVNVIGFRLVRRP